MNFVIKEVTALEDSITLTSEAGDALRLEVDGDCCSSSFFDKESKEDVQGLLGQELKLVEHVVCGDVFVKDDDWVDTIIYALKITTNKQSISVMWRNESNGYYSGFITSRFNDERTGAQYGDRTLFDSSKMQ